MKIIPRKDLLTLYWDRKFSMSKIAEMLGVGTSTIHRWLFNYKILRRSQSEAHLGQPAWNKGLTKEEDLRIAKISENVSKTKKWLYGEGKLVPWNKGKRGVQKDSLERIEQKRRIMINRWKDPEDRRGMSKKISKALTGREFSPEHRKHLAEAFKGRHTSPETEFKEGKVPKEVIANALKARLKKIEEDEEYRLSLVKRAREMAHKVNSSPELTKKRMRALLNNPTKPEKRIIQVIEGHEFPFKFVGDGSILIGNFNPDFIATNSSKKLIEVFGRAFHDPNKSFFQPDWKRQPFGRIAYFAQRGYDCLILWDDELKDEGALVKRIKNFMG